MFYRKTGVAILFAVTLLAAGCGAKSINQVLADPGRFRNQSVTVHGTVEESASVLGRGAYRIGDKGQSLWVITSGGTPRQGARVNVTGRLQQGYDLGGLASVIRVPGALQNALVLVESSRSAKD